MHLIKFQLLACALGLPCHGTQVHQISYMQKHVVSEIEDRRKIISHMFMSRIHEIEKAGVDVKVLLSFLHHLGSCSAHFHHCVPYAGPP